jgi:hypothetical protein
MIAFQWVVSPDRRVLKRLMGLLRQGDSRTAYALAGEALAGSLLGNVDLPREADELADAMIGSMMLVEAAEPYDEDPERRVQLALSTAVLSVVRPHTARACDGVISVWMGLGIGSAHRVDDPYTMAARVLLHLFLGDSEAAAEAVDALVDIDRTGVGGVLHDWTVARLQNHGQDREAQCFHALRVSLAGAPGGGQSAALVVLGAAVLNAQAFRPRSEVLPWLSAVADDVFANGTTRRSMAV